MLRTAVASLGLVVLGWGCASWLTEGFQVWTAEGARRLRVIESPVPAPAAVLSGPQVESMTLSDWLRQDGAVTIVDFVYTRCPTVCTTLGSEFQRLQGSIALDPSPPVKLLSISFDPAHDDAVELTKHAERWHADPRHWHVATVPDLDQLKRLLAAYQVVVIPDGFGGYEHNAALLVIDARGRLVRVFDYSQTEVALAYARSIARLNAVAP